RTAKRASSCRNETIDRHGWDVIGYYDAAVIPFEFKITLPLPCYGRTITRRDALGRIVRSAPAPEDV
ncbi:MAG: hypothetical protein KGJ13_11875, partial [Patescibacteria group bacterium]|nr:hypothetical protein [Patescibacteria group bacterium]